MNAIQRIVATLAVCLLMAQAFAQTAQLQVRGQTKYVHGINQAWFFGRYSNDIGLNPLHPDWGTGYNGTTVNNYFADIARMKCNVVRVWMFEGCEGLSFDSSGYVSGVQAAFLTNLTDLVNKANANGLALELVLLNHTLKDEFGQTLPNGATIKNFITDSTARQRFIDNAITPVVNQLKTSPAIFAYDLINESNIGADNGSYNWAAMRTFASAAATKIHTLAPGTQVTLSTQWWAFGDQANHPNWYGGLGLDFYEYHEYNTSPNLASKPTWLEKPLLLGEYGPSSPSTASEAQQNTATGAYIQQAKDRGWAGTLAWKYWHSAGNGENITLTEGGNQNWESSGWTIKGWGDTFFGTPPATITIYSDSLASDWANWSWSTTVNFSNTSPVRVGSNSTAVTFTAGWGAFSMRKGTAQSTSGYTKIKFWVHGGTGSNKSLTFSTQNADSGGNSSSVTVTAVANTWTEITVNLSSLGNPGTIKRINIQNNSASSQSVIYFDDIRLVP